MSAYDGSTASLKDTCKWVAQLSIPIAGTGWQHGKPHQPERQWSQRQPPKPAWHVHCPLTGSQMVLVAPQRGSGTLGNDRAIKSCRERIWLVPDPIPIFTGPEGLPLQTVGPKPYVPDMQWPQVQPMILGWQGHCPPKAHSVFSDPWGWHSHADRRKSKMNLTVHLPETLILQPPQARGTHSPRPPRWSRAEMLQTRQTQTSGMVLERPVLAASMQPAL